VSTEPKNTDKADGQPADPVVQQDKKYVLQLYVAGHSQRSIRAVASTRSICEECLSGQFELQVIDIYQQPHLAEHEHIVAVPALIKKRPMPQRRLVGDLSDKEKVLSLLAVTTSSS